MWPFPKEQKHDLMKDAMEDIKSFRDIGEKFNYMGIEMIVEDIYWSYIGCPLLFAAYKNKAGELKHVEFSRRALIALHTENQDNVAYFDKNQL